MNEWYFETLNGRFDMSQDKYPPRAGLANVAKSQWQPQRQEKREVVELDNNTVVRSVVREPDRSDIICDITLQFIATDRNRTDPPNRGHQYDVYAATLYTRETLEKLRDVINQTLETADAFETQAALDDKHLESGADDGGVSGVGVGG